MAEHSPELAHEFTENVSDYSMCVCGIPALDHDAVMARRSAEKDHRVFCRCQRLQVEVDERLALLALVEQAEARADSLAVPPETPGAADG